MFSSFQSLKPIYQSYCSNSIKSKTVHSISKSMIEFSRCYLVDVLIRFFIVSVGPAEQSTVAQWRGAAAF